MEYIPKQEVREEEKPKPSLSPGPKELSLTQGAKRIAIELEGSPEQAAQYAKKYNSLVSDIVSIAREKLSGYAGKKLQENFISEVWGIIKGNYGMDYQQTLRMNDMLDTKRFDCDTLSMLVHDVGKELGVNTRVVLTANHAFLRTDSLLFETTRGQYWDVFFLNDRYPLHLELDDNGLKALAYRTRAAFKSSQGDNAGAISDYKKSMELNQKDAAAHHNLGACYLIANKFKEAAAEFASAINLGYRNPDTYRNLGIACLKTKNMDESLAALDKAIEMNDKDQVAYRTKAMVLVSLNRFDEAAENFSKALKLNPSDTAAYMGRSVAYANLGKTELAKKDEEAAEEIMRKKAGSF